MGDDYELANIWLTARTRMVSEARLRRLGAVSHILIAFYSVFLITSSIFRDFYQNNYTFHNEFNIALSVVILSATLVSYGFHFEENARAHRECYLRLQELCDLELEEDKKKENYNNILNAFPNHTTSDYQDMLVIQIFFHKSVLYNSKGDIELTNFQVFGFLIRKIFVYTLTLIIFIAPILYLTYPFLFA